MRYRAVVLVGFMGAGKSTVGRALAERVTWDFVDLDTRIEAFTGRTIPEIFAEDGESAFRELEARIGREVLAGDHLVIATGGGWAAADGRIEDLPKDVLSVWLRVSPELAVTRVGRQAPGRPMLTGAEDPVAAAAELLARREPRYHRAALHIDTESDPVDAIVERIRQTLESRADSGLHE